METLELLTTKRRQTERGTGTSSWPVLPARPWNVPEARGACRLGAGPGALGWAGGGQWAGHSFAPCSFLPECSASSQTVHSLPRDAGSLGADESLVEVKSQRSRCLLSDEVMQRERGTFEGWSSPPGLWPRGHLPNKLQGWLTHRK